MNENGCFTALKTRENVRYYARRKSATAGLRVGAFLSQICDCRAQRVNASPFFRQTKATSLCPKSSIFVSSDHKTDDQKLRSLSKCAFAKARRACVCLCFRSGVFLGRHPWRPPLCNIRWRVCLDILVPDSLRLFWRALIVIRGFLLTSRHTR